MNLIFSGNVHVFFLSCNSLKIVKWTIFPVFSLMNVFPFRLIQFCVYSKSACFDLMIYQNNVLLLLMMDYFSEVKIITKNKLMLCDMYKGQQKRDPCKIGLRSAKFYYNFSSFKPLYKARSIK